MLDLQVKMVGEDRIKEVLAKFPELVERAKESALRSTGYNVRRDLMRAGRAMEPKLNPHTGIMSVTHGSDTGSRSGRWVDWPRKRPGKTKKWLALYAGKKKPQWEKGSSRSAGHDGLVALKLSSRRNPFSRFVQMIDYEVDVEDGLVTTGILKPRTNYYDWFRINTAGFDTRISDKMRKFLFAVGFPIKRETTKLSTPARAWIEPERDRWSRKGQAFFEGRFRKALRRYGAEV